MPDSLVAVVGRNGAGKTNLLEAVTVVGNTTSFRSGGVRAWPRRGSRELQLLATVESGARRVELSQTITTGRTVSRLLACNRRPVETTAYLELFPVMALSSEDHQLLLGPPALRRRFLDRLAFLLYPEGLATLQRYRRALRQRNALLAGLAADRQLDAFEQELAFFGARLMTLRQRAVHSLQAAFAEELEALSGSHFGVDLRYHAQEWEGAAEAAVAATKLRAALVRSRSGDRLRGYTLVGPHRHDLHIVAREALAKEVLSAGQVKLVVTALQLAAVAVYRGTSGRQPTVVFDDVDAEFDVATLKSVLMRLSGCGQVIISSAHEEFVMPLLSAATVWRMEAGAVTEQRRQGSAG